MSSAGVEDLGLRVGGHADFEGSTRCDGESAPGVLRLAPRRARTRLAAENAKGAKETIKEIGVTRAKTQRAPSRNKIFLSVLPLRSGGDILLFHDEWSGPRDVVSSFSKGKNGDRQLSRKLKSSQSPDDRLTLISRRSIIAARLCGRRRRRPLRIFLLAGRRSWRARRTLRDLRRTDRDP
jgi:hypothetical protein